MRGDGPPNPPLQRTWSSLTLGTRPLNGQVVGQLSAITMTGVHSLAQQKCPVPGERTPSYCFSMSSIDKSNGYEGISAEFLARRGSGRGVGIGVEQIRTWARSLPRHATVLELGSGPGYPTTAALVAEGLDVYAVDASPTFVETFRTRFPNTPIACEGVEDSTFFDRTFDGVLAWGLVFLLPVEEQRRLIPRVAKVLKRGGRFLFTAGDKPLVWSDAMTGQESRTLAAEEYRSLLRADGFVEIREYQDEGGNYYFDAVNS